MKQQATQLGKSTKPQDFSSMMASTTSDLSESFMSGASSVAEQVEGSFSAALESVEEAGAKLVTQVKANKKPLLILAGSILAVGGALVAYRLITGKNFSFKKALTPMKKTLKMPIARKVMSQRKH